MTISGKPVEYILDKDEWFFYLNLAGQTPRLEVLCYLRKDPDECASDGRDLFLYDGKIIPLSELPNDLVSAADLERIGIKFFKGIPIIQLEPRPTARPADPAN
jgi:hypothetical protein